MKHRVHQNKYFTFIQGYLSFTVIFNQLNPLAAVFDYSRTIFLQSQVAHSTLVNI